MKFNSMAITMGIIFGVMMALILYQSLGISAIPIGLIFGLSMSMAFQGEKGDKKVKNDKEKDKLDH